MVFQDGLAMRLRAAYLSVHRQFRGHFARFDVTNEQYIVLSLLADEDGLSQSALTTRFCSDPNTVSAVLDLLEARGLLRRDSVPGDRRRHCVRLTEQGWTLQAKLAESCDVLSDRLRAAMTPQERETVLACLKRIAEVMSSADER